MIQKVLIFNHIGWNQTVSSLVEGLKSKPELELFSTTKSNYGEDILIKSEREYLVTKYLTGGDGDNHAPSLCVTSMVVDSVAYIKECQELMDWADLIIMFDDNGSETSAHFYSDENDGKGRTKNNVLHQYSLYYHQDKIVMINPGDFSESDKMYGKYFGAEPAYYRVYFKREKDLNIDISSRLDIEWASNVEPIPFSAEERYFASGKEFDNIWDNKKLKLSALFRWEGHEEGGFGRQDIKKALNEKYYEDTQCIIGNIFGRSSEEDNIDIRLEGVDTGECVRHHHKYFDVLSQTKINIEGRPGNKAFYTGRMMESLANGCCYFYPTPTYNVDFPNGLIDGEDFIIYHSSDDLIDKIEYYLLNEDEMRTIAENGFNKLLKYHTSEVRAKEFIETCERYMYEN